MPCDTPLLRFVRPVRKWGPRRRHRGGGGLHPRGGPRRLGLHLRGRRGVSERAAVPGRLEQQPAWVPAKRHRTASRQLHAWLTGDWDRLTLLVARIMV